MTDRVRATARPAVAVVRARLLCRASPTTGWSAFGKLLVVLDGLHDECDDVRVVDTVDLRLAVALRAHQAGHPQLREMLTDRRSAGRQACRQRGHVAFALREQPEQMQP